MTRPLTGTSDRYYRPRAQPLTAKHDEEWLVYARDLFREATTKAFPANEGWPLRAREMDRLLKALGVIQHVLHRALEEVPGAQIGEPWLGYPPPRR